MSALKFSTFRNFRTILTSAATLLLLVSIISLAYVINTKRANRTTPTDSSAAQNTSEGKLVVVGRDNFETGQYEEEYYVQKSDLSVVKVESNTPIGRLRDSKVELSGISDDGRLDASAITAESAIQSITTTGTRRVAVLLSNFTNKTLPATLTHAFVNNVMDSTTEVVSVDKQFKEYSFGKLGVDGTPYGPLSIGRPEECNTHESHRAAIATFDPYINYSNVDTIIIVLPQPACDPYTAGLTFNFNVQTADGLINKPGVIVYGNSFNERVVAHELGHTLGWGHANMLGCGTSTMGYDGSCTNSEYGDLNDMMASARTYNHPNAHFKKFLGWYNAPNIITHTTGTQTYTLDAAEKLTSNPQVLIVPIGTTGMAYYIENREAIGYNARTEENGFVSNSIDGSIRDGAAIHIAPVPHNWNNTQVLDMIPSPDGGIDHIQTGLPIGSTYTDPRYPITIKPISNEAVAPPRKLTVEVTVGAFSAANPTQFTNLSATLEAARAEFRFGFTPYITNLFKVSLSTGPNFSASDSIYWSFGGGGKTPIVVTDVTKFGHYACGRTLYWRVQTEAGDVVSPSQTVTVCPGATNPPSVPVLRTPGNGGTPGTTRPLFTWNASTGNPTTYQIQIDEQNTFAAPIVVDNANIAAVASPTFTPGIDLVRYRTYYWRVRAKNAANQWSAWSTIWSFTPANPPVVLVSPANGSVSATTRPVFTWNAPVSPFVPANYQIQIDNGTDFNPALHTSGQLAVTPRSFTSPIDLARATNHYWRVRWKNSAGQWSQWAAAVNVKISQPAPTNQAPTNNTTQPLRPNFRWSAVTGATQYLLQISTTNNFAAGTVIQYTPTTNNYTIPTNLAARTRYYWRVRGNAGAFNPTPLSASWSFLTQ